MSALSASVLSLLQRQFAHENANYLRYTGRSSWARFRGFEGAADFFQQEAKGERGHADKVQKFIEDRNESIDIDIEAELPETLGIGPAFTDLFTSALDVERMTTVMLLQIYSTALTEGDFQTVVWLQDLLSEQTEEENLYQTIIDRMTQRGGGGAPDEALSAFAQDPAAAHDIDVWVGKKFVRKV